MSRWQAGYDRVLAGHHKRGMVDSQIVGRMLDEGYPVSLDDVTGARRRLGLASNHKSSRWEVQDIPFRTRPNPLATARTWLGRRLVEKPSGYWLDGIPANLDAIMRACNRVLIKQGVDQVDVCERWVV